MKKRISFLNLFLIFIITYALLAFASLGLNQGLTNPTLIDGQLGFFLIWIIIFGIYAAKRLVDKINSRL